MNSARPWIATAAIAALAAATGCGRNGADQQRQTSAASPASQAGDAVSPTGSTAGERVDAGSLTKEPSRYVGRRVTVEGPVANVLSESALAIGEEGAGQGHGLLVLVPKRAQTLPQKGRITVSGAVQLYDRDRLRSTFGAIATTPEIEARYAGQPVVIADSLRAADGREIAGALAGAQLPAGAGEPGTTGSDDRRQDADKP